MIRRVKTTPPTAIFTADWHLREDQPICRTDNFWETQWRKIDFIKQLQIENNDCPVIHAGDLFNHWKPSPHLLSETILHLPNNFHTIYGNHDLPQHNMDNANKSGVNTLLTAGKITLIPTGHWGQEIKNDSTLGMFFQNKTDSDGVKILVWHGMVFPDNTYLWPGADGILAKEMLKKYPEFPIILTGHNHTNFVVEYEHRLLINPGSITRQTSAQHLYLPRVYFWWKDTNAIKSVFLPIEETVISKAHIIGTAQLEARENRMEAFLQLLGSDGWEAGVTFERNIEHLLNKNKIPNSVREIITHSMGR